MRKPLAIKKCFGRRDGPTRQGVESCVRDKKGHQRQRLSGAAGHEEFEFYQTIQFVCQANNTNVNDGLWLLLEQRMLNP